MNDATYQINRENAWDEFAAKPVEFTASNCFNGGYDLGYEKAIDEFVERVEKEMPELAEPCEYTHSTWFNVMRSVVEEMKQESV